MGFGLDIIGYKDGKTIKTIEYASDGSPIYYFLNDNSNQNSGEVSIFQLEKIYTLYTIIDYLRPINHPLDYPSEVSRESKSYWRLYVAGDEIDTECERYSLATRETYERDTEIYHKLCNAFEELIGQEMHNSYYTDYVSVHYFDTAKQYRNDFEEMIRMLKDGEIDVIRFNGGY